MTRKLVSVQKVKELVEIPGADKIELCLINGWQVVVQKGIHKQGDSVLYYEIDSFLPATDSRYSSFEERFIKWGDKQGMRVKTIKLRKQLSQGIIMPLEPFMTELKSVWPEGIGLYEGLDLTEVLGIEKWEPIENEPRAHTPGSSSGKKFPAFIRKTDQERVQNYGTLVEKALDEEFEVTIKKDGSSLTAFRVDPSSSYYNDARELLGAKLNIIGKIKRFFTDKVYGKKPAYGICSRNLLLSLNGNSNFHKAEAKYQLLDKLEKMCVNGRSIALQLELVAPDIQGNYEKVKDIEVHLFDIFDIDEQRYLLPQHRQQLSESYAIPHATIVGVGSLRDLLQVKDGDDVVKKALDYAERDGDNKGVKAEGVVFKSTTRDFSFKAVSNSYLLSTGK